MRIINQELQTTKRGGDDVIVPHIFTELGDREQTSKLKNKVSWRCKMMRIMQFLRRQKNL
jgi:hypothetical protein